MKFCPVCRQRYEDTENFCLTDGVALQIYSAESQVPTAYYNDLNDLTIKPTEASPTILSPEQIPRLTEIPQKQDSPTNLFREIEAIHSVRPPKSNPLLISLISILGTLCVVSAIGGGAWLWLSNSKTSNDIASNLSANSNQKSSTNLKTNTSNSLPTSNKIENSKTDKKSPNPDNSNLTVSSSNKTENTSVNSSPIPSENLTVDLQVKFTDLGKTQNSPISGGSITIQTEGKTLTSVTNNAGIAYFKGVSCSKPIRIIVKSEDGSGTFTRNLKCGANASLHYQTDCFVSGKNGGCAIEQAK